ncbi:MAG TPA: SusD/RagB family nutrient-binding outer membrane lipoprotein, partial [Puia sp.]|nr:SusD/RagB family nutrient-binding outer membrane lipoprotein [Puia sp.]
MKKLLYIFLAAILTGGLTGCKKYLDKLDNPNLVTDPPLNGLLAQGTYRTGYSVFEMGDITSYYVQYLAGNTKGSDADVYNPVDYSSTWSDSYASMMNIKQMILKAQTDRAWLHLGVGQVLMALNLNMLINTFGDVPYSNALEGKNNII